MAIHTLSLGGSNYEIQPKYASSAGYAATAGNAKFATTAGRAYQAEIMKVYSDNTATNYPLLLASSIAITAGAYRTLYTDTANSLHYNPSTNVLTVPSFKTSALGVSGGVTIYNGNDLNLQANSTAATDSGDIAFKNSSGTEIGRIWLDQGTNFKLRYGSSDAAKKIIHEGNINDYLTTQTMSTLSINVGNSDGDDYYVDYDGSEDISIDSIVYANTARKTQYTLTIEHDFDGNTTEWDGSSNESINSIAWAQVAGAVNLPLTILTAAGTMTYNGSASVHITNVSYGCSAGMANIANYASSASYANYSKYLHAATSSSKLYLLGQNTGTTGGQLVYKNTNTYISSNAIYASAGFYESSDARLKTITSDVEVDFERLKSIPKIQYIKKGETAPHIGTIAQDLQKVYPEFVETGEDGYMSVDYAKLSIIPLKAVDILYDEVKKLKDEIKIVKEENQMLKDRLDNIEATITK